MLLWPNNCQIISVYCLQTVEIYKIRKKKTSDINMLTCFQETKANIVCLFAHWVEKIFNLHMKFGKINASYMGQK